MGRRSKRWGVVGHGNLEARVVEEMSGVGVMGRDAVLAEGERCG